MDLENMKSTWQESAPDKKDIGQLKKMTELKNHPSILKTRRTLLFEGALLVAFSFFYYDGLDGTEKPLWANLLLIGSATAFIITRYIGWAILQNPVRSQVNLLSSLQVFENRLKRIAGWSILSSLLFNTAILVFFSSVIRFTNGKYALLGVLAIILLISVYLSNSIWRKRIQTIHTVLENLETANR